MLRKKLKSQILRYKDNKFGQIFLVIKVPRHLLTLRTFCSAMSRRTRYFDNPYPDYDGRNAVQVNPEVWTRQALSLALNIQQNGRSVLQAVDGGLYVGSGAQFLHLNNKRLLST